MKTLVIIETTKGRETMLRTAEENLPEGTAIVRITDLLSEKVSTLTVPLDPQAEVLAREAPKLLPGGVTALTSYVIVRTRGADAAALLAAVEYRMHGTEIASSRRVTLRPERVGRSRDEVPA